MFLSCLFKPYGKNGTKKRINKKVKGKMVFGGLGEGAVLRGKILKEKTFGPFIY